MEDCCKLPEGAAAPADRCRRCGAQGRRVPQGTMESLLKPEARERLREHPYYFDRTPSCEVVYFSNESEGSYFTKDALQVRVGIKETEPPIPICYCFGHTVESAREELLSTGRSTVAEQIAAEIRAGRCACEIKNPSGACCLDEVSRVISRLQEELWEGSITATKKGDGG